MAKMTQRDYIWKTALVLRGETEAGRYSDVHGVPGFTARDCRGRLTDAESAPDPSLRTIRDVLVSMTQLGELTRRGGRGSGDFYFRAPRD